MKLQDKLVLGQEITVFSKLVRNSISIKGGYNVFWVSVKIPPTKVCVVGMRTLRNGTTWYEAEVGNLFDPKEFLTGVLVVAHLWRKPFYVHANDITVNKLKYNEKKSN